MDIRKIIIIFVVGILFSILVFSVIEAVYPRPKYEDYCKVRNHPIKEPGVVQQKCPDVKIAEKERKDCDEKKGYIEFTDYDVNDCPTSFICNTCDYEFRIANEKYQRVVFYVSAVLSLMAIFLGLFLPAKQNTLNEWIGTGFMLGGTFSLFFGTATSFTSLDRYTRPVVIFLELVLVIFIAYRKVSNLREDKEENKKLKK